VDVSLDPCDAIPVSEPAFIAADFLSANRAHHRLCLEAEKAHGSSPLIGF
jgi:hypothetical protein